jgi:integrase
MTDTPLLLGEATARFLAHIEPDYERVMSWRRIAVSLRAVVAHLGEQLPLLDLSPDLVEEFKRLRLRTLKPVSVRHDLINFGLFVRHARRRAWLPIDPLDGVRIPSDRDAVRIRVLTDEEEGRYLDAARPNRNLYALARLMLATGLRPSEARFLRVGDFQAGMVYIRNGKSRSARRTLKLVGETGDVIVSLAGSRSPAEYLFCGRYLGKPATPMNNAHHEACHRAGLVDQLGRRDIRIYDLRHTFATRMANRGMPLTTLAAILGHSNLRCVLCYVHTQQAAMDEALLRFAA